MNREEVLNKLAEEELLREAERGAARATVGGALAWKKCPLQPVNKQFLFNVIHHTVNANKIKSEQCKKKQERTADSYSGSELKKKKRKVAE